MYDLACNKFPPGSAGDDRTLCQIYCRKHWHLCRDLLALHWEAIKVMVTLQLAFRHLHIVSLHFDPSM